MRRTKSDDRRARVTDLWNQQPESVRNSKDAVLKFYLWLQEHSPEALPPINRGDPYEELKRNLGDHIRKDQL